MIDIVEQLRKVPSAPSDDGWNLMVGKYCHEAADYIVDLELEVGRQNSEIHRLRELLDKANYAAKRASSVDFIDRQGGSFTQQEIDDCGWK